MNQILRNILVLLFIAEAAFSAAPALLYARDGSTKKKFPSEVKKKNMLQDSLQKDNLSLGKDTSSTAAPDTLVKKTIRKGSSGLDSTVSYFAKDTVVFNIKSKSLRLKGDAKLEMKAQKLESEVIELYFDDNLLKAAGAKDSTGKIYGFPKFKDGSEEFVGETINYNFKSGKGTISLGETEMGDGFYFGSKIKRISQDELYVQNGCYTTCDAPHPHYYFGSTKMKVIAQDRVLLDPLIFYVEDMPVFEVPFGLFFPAKGGRQSGLIVPSFYFSKDRGVVLQNLGFYWAASDYWDTQITTDIFTKGGFNLKNSTRWNLRDNFSGSYDLQLGRTRFNPDAEYTKNWSIALRHRQILTPQQSLDVNLSFASQDFNRNTSTNLADRITQNITSNAAYSLAFDNGSNLSVSYQRDQNIITNTYTQSVPVSYSLPNYYPLKDVSFIPADSWVRDVSFSYNGGFRYSDSKQLSIGSRAITPDSSVIDTAFKFSDSKYISHSPRIGISPRFGYFTVNPSVSLNANNFFRRITRTVNPNDSSIVTRQESGFYSEYFYGLSLTVSTKLYGMITESRPLLGFIKPKTMGITAFRHTYQPSISFSYTPDFSGSKWGFYGEYFDPKLNSKVKYSRFELDGASHASQYLTKSLSYNDQHTLEIKVPQKDTVDKNVELLKFGFSGGYNFAADSLKFSDINLNFRTPAISVMNLTGSAGFSLYDQAPVLDESGRNTGYFRNIDKFLISDGKGLASLRNFSLSLETSLNSTGLTSTSEILRKKPQDSVSLGERFSNKVNYNEEFFDYFGDSTPGYYPWSVPWTLNFSLRMSYNVDQRNMVNRTVNLATSFDMKLTQTWSLRTTGSYDLVKRELLTPDITITKDMHCWNLMVNWTPTGFNRGFHLVFGIKAAQLQDLKFERKSSPLLR